MRVTLVGIEAVSGHNQSEELVYEADRLWVMGRHDLAEAFTLRCPEIVETLADDGEAQAAARAAAVAFATRWRDQAGDAELAELLADRPRIPRPLDVELITTVERAIDRSLQNQKDLKKDLRAAWWGVIGGGRPRRPSTPNQTETDMASDSVVVPA